MLNKTNDGKAPTRSNNLNVEGQQLLQLKNPNDQIFIIILYFFFLCLTLN